MIAPPPLNEAGRLAALRQLNILDTPSEVEFNDLTRLAADICGTPIALLSLVDACRQWFKSRIGLDATELHRDIAFCSHAILGNELFVVPDANTDERFHDNPLVTGEPTIRFYAGMPLTTPDGFNLGSLCVIDRVPRTLSPHQLDALQILGRQVVAQLVLRQQLEHSKKIEVALRESENRFRAFMDSSPVVAFMKDGAGRYAYVNDAVVRRFGHPVQSWIGNTDETLFPENYSAAWRENDRCVLVGGKAVEFSESVLMADGSDSHWTTYKFPFQDASGQIYLAGIGVDVTEKKLAEDALQRSEAKFRSTVDRLSEGMFVVDPATREIIEANPAVLAMLGYSSEEFCKLTVLDLVAVEARDIVECNMRHVESRLERDGRCDLGRKHLRHKNGSAIPVEIQVASIPHGASARHAVVVRDMTEQAAHEEQLFRYQSDLEDANEKLKLLATTDALTQVRNRRAFNDRVLEEYDRATRYGRSLSVLMLDVDHFKLFNDTFGHPAGDEVLKSVAKVLQDTARTTDFLARYGGEEFIILLPDTDAPGAVVLAERFRRAVAGIAWEKRPVTVSIGVTTLTQTSADANQLVEQADAALYRSKQAGRNRVTVYRHHEPNSHRRAPSLAIG